MTLNDYETVTENICNGNIVTYCKVNGTCFTSSFYDKGEQRTENSYNPGLWNILERCRKEHTRCRIWYGNTETGLSWNEEYEVIGYISRSSGSIKIPILLYNKRSVCGSPILDRRIVRIDDIKSKTTLYKNDNFHTSEFSIFCRKEGTEYERKYPYCVTSDGVMTLASFSSYKKAMKYIQFLRGERYAK